MADTKAEIARVEKALAETKSPYLKRDYEKYLRKLRKRLSERTNSESSENMIRKSIEKLVRRALWVDPRKK